MNMSPGDIIVYDTALAGPDIYNYNKGIIGLGFDFPVDVLRDAPKVETAMGLDLYTDTNFDDENISLSSSSDDLLATSWPPLLGLGRERRLPTPGTLWSEYAPIHIASPGLCAGPAGEWNAGVTLYLPAPAVPTLTLPSTPISGVEIGLDLPVLDDAALALHTHSLAAPLVDVSELRLPGFDDRDCTAIVPGLNGLEASGAARTYKPTFEFCLVMPDHVEHRAIIDFLSPVLAAAPIAMPVPIRPRPHLLRSLHEQSIADNDVSTPSSPSSPLPSGTYAAPIFHAARAEPAKPRALPHHYGLVGLGLWEEDGEAIVLEGASTIESPVSRRTFLAAAHSESPLSDPNSTYASSVDVEHRSAEELRMALLSRLPIIEED